ncbi:MAG: xylulokinase, partial [Gammaproteobacteria bacterium]
AENSRPVYEKSLNFEAELGHYGIIEGHLPIEENGVVHAPPLMWVEALDRILLDMGEDGFEMDRIVAVAGSAQQHGSVYLNARFDEALGNCDPSLPLNQQLTDVFSRKTSPIWMDQSTSKQCGEIAAAFGGARRITEATGSVAVERFTGAQIKKFADQEPKAYSDTRAILLVSSFLASLFAGRRTGIDYTDASGMNLLDIRRKTWHPTALSACAENLEEKLSPPADPRRAIGSISGFFVRRYGFDPGCIVLPWCGDNPSSLVGLGLIQEGMTAVSLGTSDTCFGLMKKLPDCLSPWAHAFIAPTNDYMLLLCFKNGSLAREAVRKQFDLSWDEFTTALQSTEPGNLGGWMVPWFEAETVPKIDKPGVRRFGLDINDPAANCRAVVEGQMMSMRNHAEEAGLIPTAIKATGGASRNPAILQIMADVFSCPVVSQETSNSAALGAAFRALQVLQRTTWPETVAGFSGMAGVSRFEPSVDAGVYERLRRIYRECESALLSRFENES